MSKIRVRRPEDWEFILCGWISIVCFLLMLGGMH
jgi:hypothetical protein